MTHPRYNYHAPPRPIVHLSDDPATKRERGCIVGIIVGAVVSVAIGAGVIWAIMVSWQ